ncbi:MAG: hypothetical protein I3J02_10830 [Prevotella sp.]|nr:hypothetical protein [Prevotella sp.]
MSYFYQTTSTTSYRWLIMVLFFLLPSTSVIGYADVLDSLEQSFQNNSQIQEKIYVHTDNNCYFIGDTIWYKAYVLRADDHRPTDMSKLLYVELLSPDGLVVDRQHIVVSDKGMTSGQFALKDSLYSGYYEIRAYTRWMLNFNVSHREYTIDDRHRFYNDRMAKDYYRDWKSLYSRVLPVYSKPKSVGDYDGKYMYKRPKMEMPWTPKKEIVCRFYPEGGHLVQGLKSRVAFEVVDQDGRAVDISGRLDGSDDVKTSYMGRGVLYFTPSADSNRGKVSFRWNNSDFDFKLPKAQEHGVVVTRQMSAASDQQVSFTLQNTGIQPAGYAVMCRGKLYDFKRLSATGTISIDTHVLPTGVNELQVYDSNGNVLADRLFFVNHHDKEESLQISTDKLDYQAYEPILVTVKALSTDIKGLPVSLSVRDTRTDDTSFDDGNMMTDMLLSSDLQGFIASPAYYFERDDEQHRQALDLLMMVQGWRKYAEFESNKNTQGWGKIKQATIRYQPEKTLTIEGSVNKQLGVDLLTINDISKLNDKKSVAEEGLEHAEKAVTVGNVTQYTMSMNTDDSNEQTDDSALGISESTDTQDNPDDQPIETNLGVNHGSLKNEVLVEAEITKDGQTAGLVQKTHNGGRFSFQIPPFYDKAVLFMTAYEPKDSAKRALTSRTDKTRMDEESYPDFYVKRDLFYPVFSHPYNYYQTHLPDMMLPTDAISDEAENGQLKGDHTLGTVKVEARRRGRRATDFTKPAYVIDAYDLYNEATDRGLSWGVVNMGNFPPIACVTVYGNMNRKRDYNILARLDNYTFYQNFSSTIESIKNRSVMSVFNDLHLKRIKNFRFYTDYEPRNYADPHTEQLNVEDVTLVYELIPDDGKRYTYRDRRYILPGITYPEQQYSPDYSKMKPSSPTDYRRTLYWNPNAQLDDKGEFHTTVYNNSRESRVKVSATGVTSDGKFLIQK